MSQPESSPDPIEAALDRALSENLLDQSYRETLRRYVYNPSSQWRVCCGSGCDPCIMPIARAVDMVRQLIQWPEPAQT